jgi:phage shock protein PspC (stress-responsive transcriptional regulator)
MDEQNFPNIFEEPDQKFIPPKKFERVKSDHIVAGVCAGIAKYFNTEPAIIRLFFLLSLLLGIWSIAAYFVAAFLIPLEKDAEELTIEEKQFQRQVNFRTIAGGILILSGFHFGFVELGIISRDRIFAMSYGFLFPFISIIIGAFFLGLKDDGMSYAINLNDKFLRPRSGRLFMGVCAGFAKYINAESTTVRIIFILASVLTLGFFALVYFLIAILVKSEEPKIASEQ